MSTPFKVPDRNAPYRSTKNSYEGFWASAGRDRATTVPHPTINRFPSPFPFANIVQPDPKVPIMQPVKANTPAARAKEEKKETQSDIIKQLAKKSKKQVREWFLEQVEALNDSDED